MSARALVVPLLASFALAGCGHLTTAVLEPACKTAPSIEAEAGATLLIARSRDGSSLVYANAVGRLKRSCRSSPKTIKGAIAKFIASEGERRAAAPSRE